MCNCLNEKMEQIKKICGNDTELIQMAVIVNGRLRKKMKINTEYCPFCGERLAADKNMNRLD